MSGSPAKFQVMPALTPEEYAALKDSINKNGLLVPILVDEVGDVIDGHNRKKICEELRIDCQTQTFTGLEHDDIGKRTLARKLNIARRHLNQEQKRQLIDEHLEENHRRSDRAIAEDIGVDHKTVSAVRAKWEAKRSGEIPQSATRTGKDGKQRPAARAPKKAGAPAPPPAPTPAQSSAQETVGALSTLRMLKGTEAEAMEALGQLAKLDAADVFDALKIAWAEKPEKLDTLAELLMAAPPTSNGKANDNAEASQSVARASQ